MNDDLTLIGLGGSLRTASGHQIGAQYLRDHRERFGFSDAGRGRLL